MFELLRTDPASIEAWLSEMETFAMRSKSKPGPLGSAGLLMLETIGEIRVAVAVAVETGRAHRSLPALVERLRAERLEAVVIEWDYEAGGERERRRVGGRKTADAKKLTGEEKRKAVHALVAKLIEEGCPRRSITKKVAIDLQLTEARVRQIRKEKEK